MKRPGVGKMLLPKYHSNDTENRPGLFPIYPIRFSNLPGFNQPFPPVEMETFCTQPPLENLQKRTKTTSKVYLRLTTMSPLYPCGKPCSIGTHNETVKTRAYLLYSIMIRLIESASNDCRSSVQQSFLGKKMRQKPR